MFQELFDSTYFYYERSFQIKNMYAYDQNYQKWISINSTYLEYAPESVAGRKELGYTKNYFYGISGPAMEGEEYDPSTNNPP